MIKQRFLASCAVMAVLMATPHTPLQGQTFYSPETSESFIRGFGQAVAVGQNEIFVGEPTNSVAPGIVYVFRPSNGTWQEALELRASNQKWSDSFGSSLATGGSTLFIGAPAQNDGNGAVYVFTKTGQNWNEAAILTAGDASEGDSFGSSVAFRDGRLFVGSVGHDGGAGAVYVFSGNGARWNQVTRLTASDAAPDLNLGAAISVDGDAVLVGATGNGGAAYLFRQASGAWVQEAKLTIPGNLAATPGGNQGRRFGPSAAFGQSLLLSGSYAYVAHPGANTTGAVFRFDYSAETGTWSMTGGLTAFEFDARQQFGASIASAGNELWVGAPGSNAIYRYQMGMDGTPLSASKLAAEDAGAGDRFATSFALGNGVAVVGLTGDDFGAGTAVVYERNNAGEWINRSKILSEVKGIPAVAGGQLDCAEGIAHVFDCNQVDLVSFVPVSQLGGLRGTNVNDVWGWTHAASGREFALVGRRDGTSFVEITDAANPRVIGDLPLTEGARPATWRDIKVYRDHAFIVSDGAGPHGMQVFDLTQLLNVRSAPQMFVETAHYSGINSAHNIVINEATGYAFSVGSSQGGETCGGGLHMINIQDPRSPTFAGCFADPSTGRRGTGYSHDAMCIIYNGPDSDHTGKEICFGANETALSIADVTDKESPRALSMASYPNVAYSHQGWITEDHRYFYMNDELDELSGNIDGTRTLVWDVTDLDDPILVKEHISEVKASDHNLYIKGNFMYQSNYQAGLRILNVADPANPVEVAYFDTVPYGTNDAGMGGSWSNYPYFPSGTIIVTSGNEGLFIVKHRAMEIIP